MTTLGPGPPPGPGPEPTTGPGPGRHKATMEETMDMLIQHERTTRKLATTVFAIVAVAAAEKAFTRIAKAFTRLLRERERRKRKREEEFLERAVKRLERLLKLLKAAVAGLIVISVTAFALKMSEWE